MDKHMDEKMKCHECNKKLLCSINDFKCKCNHYFCSKHRYPEDHGCIFDYKKEAKDILGEKLIKTVKRKIDHI